MLLTRSDSRMCDQQFFRPRNRLFVRRREGYAHRVLQIAFGWLLSPLVTGSTSGLLKSFSQWDILGTALRTFGLNVLNSTKHSATTRTLDNRSASGS